MKLYLLLIIFSVFFTLPIIAVENIAEQTDHSKKSKTLSPLVVSALEFGGEDLAYVKFTDGSQSTIEAGRGLLLAGGFDFRKDNIIIQFTGGIKWTTTKAAKNGAIDWMRFPLEVLLFYQPSDQPIKIGGRLTYHLNNSLKGSKDVGNLKVNFDNALGYTAEADYLLGSERNSSVGLRATMIQYQAPGNIAVSGNSLGLNFNYFWY